MGTNAIPIPHNKKIIQKQGLSMSLKKQWLAETLKLSLRTKPQPADVSLDNILTQPKDDSLEYCTESFYRKIAHNIYLDLIDKYPEGLDAEDHARQEIKTFFNNNNALLFSFLVTMKDTPLYNEISSQRSYLRSLSGVKEYSLEIAVTMMDSFVLDRFQEAWEYSEYEYEEAER